MTWLGRVVRLLPFCALFALSASCGFFVSNSSIETVTITPTAVLLAAAATPADSYTALSSTSLTAGGTTGSDTSTATWTSSNPSVVTVSAGVLTAGAATSGTATVTAKDGGVTSNACTVVLYTGAAPTTLTVGSQIGTTSFQAGTSFQAIATATFPGDTSLSPPNTITPYVTWSSSDATLATVNSNGVVTVLSASPFTITATASFGAAATSATVTGQQEFNNTTII